MKTAQASWRSVVLTALFVGLIVPAPAARAEDATDLAPMTSQRPKPRALPVAAVAAAAESTTELATGSALTASDTANGKGPVTNLALPRYVSLKGKAGNARRGPSTSHRIDWVFTAPGMPLRVTAEYENWRRVEDKEGMGGWVHYALLSGSRTVLVRAEVADFLSHPKPGADVVFRAERNVIARLLECQADWCRVNADGEKGWVQKTALWGVDPGELVE